MKVQTQGPGECWLAVACMLADYPLERMRRAIAMRFGYSWARMTDMRRKKGHWARRDAMAEFVVERAGVDRILLQVNWVYGNTIKRGRAPRLGIPPGRGAISLVKYRAKNYRTGRRYIRGHIVAFENGRIYNPHGDVYDETQFNAAFRGWRVERVVQVPREP